MTIAPLQIPSWQQPRDMDFSPLAKLPEVYRQAQQDAMRRQTLATLGDGTSLREVSMQLARGGDVEGAQAVANIGRTHANSSLLDGRTAQMSQGDIETLLASARRTIAANPAGRDAVLRRLRQWGIDTSRF